MTSFSTFERLGIITAFAIISGTTISLLITFSLGLHTLSLGLMIAGIIFIVLGLAFCCESYSHHRSRKVQFTVDRRGRVYYLPGASQRVASQKHEEPPTARFSKSDMKVLGLIFLIGIAFIVASAAIHFLVLILSLAFF